MLVSAHRRLISGVVHGGFHGGRTFWVHLFLLLVMIALTIVLSAAATAGMSEWADRHFRSADSTKAAAWITFVVVFAVLGWLTLRVL